MKYEYTLSCLLFLRISAAGSWWRHRQLFLSLLDASVELEAKMVKKATHDILFTIRFHVA